MDSGGLGTLHQVRPVTNINGIIDHMMLHHRDLETPTQSLNSLLLRYTRTSTNHKGEKVYNAKHVIK